MRLVVGLLGALLSVGAASTVSAHDVEPNDTCRASPWVRPARMPRSLTGILDARRGSAREDVDFFPVSARPGELVRASNESPERIAVFDGTCQQIALSEPGQGLEFKVPDSGLVAIAIGDALDGERSSRPRTRSLAYRLVLYYLSASPVCAGGDDDCLPSP